MGNPTGVKGLKRLVLGSSFFCFFVCRHVLASLHFNENVQRETQIGENGQYLRVCYPKYKLGEEVVRDVKIPQLMVFPFYWLSIATYV